MMTDIEMARVMKGVVASDAVLTAWAASPVIIQDKTAMVVPTLTGPLDVEMPLMIDGLDLAPDTLELASVPDQRSAIASAALGPFKRAVVYRRGGRVVFRVVWDLSGPPASTQARRRHRPRRARRARGAVRAANSTGDPQPPPRRLDEYLGEGGRA
jgi:hypothetical protein